MKTQAVDVDMWMLYDRWVRERHHVWESRQLGMPAPWSRWEMMNHKFTNVFRILDHGSQYALDMLCDDAATDRDRLARILLYRLTPNTTAWDWMRKQIGVFPTESFVRSPGMQELMHQCAWETGENVFGNAYIVYPGKEKGADKIDSICGRVAGFMESKLSPQFLCAPSLRGQVRALMGFEGIGGFVAMQTATEYNYGPWGHDWENEYILPGPGARKGASYLWPGMDAEQATRRTWEIWRWESEDAPTIFGRRNMSLMDVQNTLCEFSKCVRYLKQAPAAPYRPAHPGAQKPPRLPAAWTLDK